MAPANNELRSRASSLYKLTQVFDNFKQRGGGGQRVGGASNVIALGFVFVLGLSIGLSWRSDANPSESVVEDLSVAKSKPSLPRNKPAPTSGTPSPYRVLEVGGEVRELPEVAQRNAAIGRALDSNYVLELENPGLLANKKAAIQANVAKNAEARDERYTQVFSALGLSSDAAAQLKHQISKTDEARALFSMYEAQFLKAQSYYDNRVRSMLAPEAYTRYKEFEDSSGARDEVALIRAFADSKGISLDDETAEAIQNLIQNCSAYTLESPSDPGSPYLPPAQQVFGQANSIKVAETRLSSLQFSLTNVFTSPTLPQLSAQGQTALYDYYSEWLNKEQKQIEYMRLDPLEKTARFHEQRGETAQAQHFRDILAKKNAGLTISIPDPRGGYRIVMSGTH